MQPRGGRGLSIDRAFQQQNGSPQYLGTIQSTGTNVISSLSSTIVKGGRYLVQPDASGYVNPGNHATTPVAPNVTNSAVNGVKLSTDQKYYLTLAADDSPYQVNGQSFIQWISVTGTTNLKVWRLR